MAWEISISTEGWTEIRAALEEWSRESLIEAIADDTFEAVYAKSDDQHASRASAAERMRLEQLPHDLLVDRAFELIEQNGTCENGGWAYWVDREGHHRVELVGS